MSSRKPRTIKKSCWQSELKRQTINLDVKNSSLSDVAFFSSILSLFYTLKY